MKRYDYMENKNPRPMVPYQEYHLFDGIFKYHRGPFGSQCHLALYKNGDTILGIAHESEENPKRTIGASAHVLWRSVSDQYVADKYIFVQGWEGVYEYVKFGTSGFAGRRSINQISDPVVSWHPAGTLEEVLQRHLG